MRRKYGDCQRQDGNCTLCSLVNYGRDCHNRPITKLEWARLAAGLGKNDLAERSGVPVNYISDLEAGRREAGRMTAKNLLSIADALGVEVRDLI